MFGEAGFIIGVDTSGDIASVTKIIKRFLPKFHTLLEAAKSQPLMLLIESVGPAKQATGGKWPTILVVAAFDKVLFGQFFVSGVVVDDRDRSGSTDIEPTHKLI